MTLYLKAGSERIVVEQVHRALVQHRDQPIALLRELRPEEILLSCHAEEMAESPDLFLPRDVPLGSGPLTIRVRNNDAWRVQGVDFLLVTDRLQQAVLAVRMQEGSPQLLRAGHKDLEALLREEGLSQCVAPAEVQVRDAPRVAGRP